MTEQPEFDITTDNRKRFCKCPDNFGLCRCGPNCFWFYFNDYPKKVEEQANG